MYLKGRWNFFLTKRDLKSHGSGNRGASRAQRRGMNGYFPNSLLEPLCFVSAWRQRWHDPNKSVFSRPLAFKVTRRGREGPREEGDLQSIRNHSQRGAPRRARPASACPVRLIRSSAGIIPGSSACHRYGKGLLATAHRWCAPIMALFRSQFVNIVNTTKKISH